MFNIYGILIWTSQKFQHFSTFHWKPAEKPKEGVVLAQNLGQIRFDVAKKVKKVASTGFFYILHGEYILKQEVVVIETPEWKFNANIDRNAIFEGCYGQIFAQFG